MDTESSAENDSPPCYDSLFGKVVKAKDDSDGLVDFVLRIIAIDFCGTIWGGIWIAITLALSVTYIVLGVMYLDDCPREKYIPIYLIVYGSFDVFKSLMTTLEKLYQCASNSERKILKPLSCLVGWFVNAWFIAGSVWVFSIYGDYQHEFPERDDYCHKTLYEFSFWLLIAQYIVLGLAICGCCGCSVVILCFMCREYMVRSASNGSTVVV